MTTRPNIAVRLLLGIASFIPMLAMRLVLAIAILSSGCTTASSGEKCPIPGEAIQWQADFCMFETETDDLIAAQPCMDRESLTASADSCAAKRHYKRALCKLVVEGGLRPGSVEDCFNDPTFSGPTVRSLSVSQSGTQ